MTPSKKILKRALEMACKKVWTGFEFGCDDIKCKFYGKDEYLGECDNDGCEKGLIDHFIRKATAESKGKGRKK